MAEKTLPFTRSKIEEIMATWPTPFHIYDEKGIRENARELLNAFSIFPSFKEYFAVKAAPNPWLMKILKEEGIGADCSSLAELILAEKVGLRGSEIMFSSNNTPIEEYRKAYELEAIINLDDFTHIDFLHRQGGLPELVCMRYNPGPLKQGNAIIGTPEEAKYGFTREQIFEGIKIMQGLGVKKFALHTMVASNELNESYFVETADLIFSLAADLHRELGVRFEFVNLGGGIGIPYRPEDKKPDIRTIARGIKEHYDRLITANGLDPLQICLECGRMITGPYGYLVTTAIHRKNIYRDYIGVDACMANLMRPALYGAYHHITVLGKEDAPCDHVYDVTGSLCENNDKFAIQRSLPEIKPGDILVMHDAGAHGHAMGFNYNGKPRSAELLLRTDGSVQEIRRAETLDDLFATLDFKGL